MQTCFETSFNKTAIIFLSIRCETRVRSRKHVPDFIPRKAFSFEEIKANRSSSHCEEKNEIHKIKKIFWGTINIFLCRILGKRGPLLSGKYF